MELLIYQRLLKRGWFEGHIEYFRSESTRIKVLCGLTHFGVSLTRNMCKNESEMGKKTQNIENPIA